LSREHEDSDFGFADSNHSIEFESTVADPRCETSPLPALSAKIAVEKIFSQL
jgi:hypothetical protein